VFHGNPTTPHTHVLAPPTNHTHKLPRRRSIPTTSNDRIYCKILAHNAVHAAFAGYTGITVGLVNTHYVYLPIPVIIQAVRKVDPRGKMWNRLRASIGQPNFV
jgi:6-phosphofructokinase 1